MRKYLTSKLFVIGNRTTRTWWSKVSRYGAQSLDRGLQLAPTTACILAQVEGVSSPTFSPPHFLLPLRTLLSMIPVSKKKKKTEKKEILIRKSPSVYRHTTHPIPRVPISEESARRVCLFL